ncbi:hypothetical protein IW249_003475 [Micromonospora vinacea]|uniref:Uncharacterized protein n=1 Tax=Micromonospora vinacea TaxID=709878 RepID=A0ABS0K377_9ACTN|nr:hypothetical protein [Micromonospora vinacea]MBG6103061.1 hypothetical protein [Micromonospora vinacea]WTA69330.1 hypothetical protein OHB51_09295 [Micromonospora sp. NBC_00855]
MSRPTMPGTAPSRPPWRRTGSALLAELISTGPGSGLLLALLGCLLIPLAGSLPDGRKRTDRPGDDRPDQAQ